MHAPLESLRVKSWAVFGPLTGRAGIHADDTRQTTVRIPIANPSKTRRNLIVGLLFADPRLSGKPATNVLDSWNPSSVVRLASSGSMPGVMFSISFCKMELRLLGEVISHSTSEELSLHVGRWRP